MDQTPFTLNFTTDHIPITIHFVSPDRVRRPYRPNAPKWLAAYTNLQTGINLNDHWRRDKRFPCKDLHQWNQSVLSTVKAHFQRLEANRHATRTRTASLSAVISLYRTCTTHPYSSQRTRSLFGSHTDLCGLVDLELNIDTAPYVVKVHEHTTRLIIEELTGGQTVTVGT
jgi:hypothetical protein